MANKPVFTEYLAKTLIADTENRIIKLKKDLDGIGPQLEEYKQAYEKLKISHDEIKGRLEQEDALLEFLSRGKNGIPEGVEFRVNRAESHNEMKDREKRKYVRAEVEAGQKKKRVVNRQFSWNDYAVELLGEEGKFTTTEDLWDMIDIKHDIKNRLKREGRSNVYSNLKWGAIHACWGANSKSTREGKATGRLILIGDKVGLSSWVDRNFQPLPQFVEKRNGQQPVSALAGKRPI